MNSIFSLQCATCGAALVPRRGAVWSCGRCNQLFEVCGEVLVSVIPDEPLCWHHEPVDAEGSSTIGDRRSPTSWS